MDAPVDRLGDVADAPVVDGEDTTLRGRCRRGRWER